MRCCLELRAGKGLPRGLPTSGSLCAPLPLRTCREAPSGHRSPVSHRQRGVPDARTRSATGAHPATSPRSLVPGASVAARPRRSCGRRGSARPHWGRSDDARTPLGSPLQVRPLVEPVGDVPDNLLHIYRPAGAVTEYPHPHSVPQGFFSSGTASSFSRELARTLV